jgi:thioredoxin reductase (NADPH)
VLTGRDLGAAEPGPPDGAAGAPATILETSSPGRLRPPGDVRHRSVKRVASAVGEGAIAIQFVHEYLVEQPT